MIHIKQKKTFLILGQPLGLKDTINIHHPKLNDKDLYVLDSLQD